MDLKYRADKTLRNVRRQRSLPREEEKALAEKEPDFISTQLYSLLQEISLRDAWSCYHHPDFFRANSLVWIWVQMKPKMILSNIRILMARKGLTSINQLAAALKMNASFVGRMLAMQSAVDFGGWNVENVFKIATVLDARPELMMTTDLSSRVQEEVVNWQI